MAKYSTDIFFTSGSRVHPDAHEDDQRVEAGGQSQPVHQAPLEPATHLCAEADAPGQLKHFFHSFDFCPSIFSSCFVGSLFAFIRLTSD